MLLLYSNITTTRSKYVFDLVFNVMGVKYQFTNDKLFFEKYRQEKINYSDSPIVGDEFFINTYSLLQEKSIKKINLKIKDKFQTKILFPSDTPCDLGFDIFSAVFYMVTRYEEYLPFQPDSFGRFKATDSVAHKNNFLQAPVVDIWIASFKNLLLKKFPFLETKTSKFNAIATYDIDVAFKYKGRNCRRAVGAFGKDLLEGNIKNFYNRWLTFFKIKKDPWDTYDYLEGIIAKNKLHSIFFFLLADNSHNDRNISHKNQLLKSLIKKTVTFSEIGIHPGFQTSAFPQKISTEKERLENISGVQITKSRQHFLKFTLPGTYNHLIAAGIEEDYSMGFADCPGFRAGTCTPYYFYDLKNETTTPLKIYPVTCMEAGFIQYLKMKPAKALQQILALMKQVKMVNGTFISIWHNDSIGDGREYKDWEKVHSNMINQMVTYLRH